jgi:hypothetical protein
MLGCFPLLQLISLTSVFVFLEFTFKNPKMIIDQLKTYVQVMKLKDVKALYFSPFNFGPGSRRVTRKVFYSLYHPTLNVRKIKFPLFATKKEPASWAFCKIGNYFFLDKKSLNSFKMESTQLFQQNLRVNAQQIQLLVLLKTAQKMQEKKAAGGAEGAAGSPDGSVPPAAPAS